MSSIRKKLLVSCYSPQSSPLALLLKMLVRRPARQGIKPIAARLFYNEKYGKYGMYISLVSHYSVTGVFPVGYALT